MKIKLNRKIAVADKHGMRQGREFETVRNDNGNPQLVYVMGDAGELVGIHHREYDLIEEDEELSAPPAGCLC